MAESLDFKDISNSLFLSQPCNRDIASSYAQLKILDMASLFPEIKDHPYSANVVNTSECGKYDPLAMFTGIESVVNQIKACMMEQVIPPEKRSQYCIDGIPIISWEEVQMRVEDYLTNPTCMAVIPEDFKKDLTDLGNFFTVYDAAMDMGVEMRNEYSRVVQTVRSIAKQRDLDSKKILNEMKLEQKLRDHVTKQAFPTRDLAESHFEKLFFYLGMFKLFYPTRDCIMTYDENWNGFVDMLKALDLGEVDKLIEKNMQYAVMEADRLYGSDTGF